MYHFYPSFFFYLSQAVLEVLGLWQDLQFATQQRYLETPDPDGENAFQLAVKWLPQRGKHVGNEGNTRKLKPE
jgi:hypothetical protein